MNDGYPQTPDGDAIITAKKNRAGKCLLCNDELSHYDSKYVCLINDNIICTAHRVRDWQAREIEFKLYRYWTDG